MKTPKPTTRAHPSPSTTATPGGDASVKSNKKTVGPNDAHWIEDFGETPADMPSAADLARFGARLCIMWPVIDVAKSADIPKDYPGPMAVPITFLDKLGRNDGRSGFRIIGKAHHGTLKNGKKPFQKLIVINTALRERMVNRSPDGRAALGREAPK